MFFVHEGMSIEGAVQKGHYNSFGGTAGVGPAHRSAPLLLVAKEDMLFEFAMREARLTHWDPIAGRTSAASLLICQYLLQDWSLKDISQKIEERFGHDFCFASKELDDGGYAPKVFEAAWYFLHQTTCFEDALQKSLDFAGQANYCPVLVGLWAACLYKYVPDQCLCHSLCPPNSNSVVVTAHSNQV